ncbi:hypothetical protein BVC93_07035 [Mycobacterium sp. MS1601]|uniref:AMP-binding protein n=1 Tax=Mycobacterium sp. MS1601 TaxID=1936029 RepID=UPI0009798511|nr:AMP-binding protein [Mycobacterium sp. MS1601]AQA02225.1 hypothetical protein BVC93_07035 [Mycobacterium sp. MS1601]
MASGDRQSFARVLAARAKEQPTDIVLVDDHHGITCSAAELDAESNRRARAYRAAGVQHNSIVSVVLSNTVDFVVACAAIWKLGATPNPVSPELPPDTRSHLEALARPALVIGRPAMSAAIPWLPASAGAAESAAPLPDAWADSWKATTTSGSTGTAKIVQAAAPALVNPHQQVAPFLPLRAVQLVTAPLWHSAQFTYAMRGLLTGHRLVLTDRFDERWFADLVDTHRVTWTMLAPSTIRRVLRGARHSDLPSLRTLLHLGAPCAPVDKRALLDWLGPHRVVEVYAGSESNGLTMISGADWLRKPGSVGTPIGGTVVRIRRDDGTDAATGEIGQVWMRRGEQPAYTYLGGVSRRTPQGWDTLGDLGFLDDEGYLFLMDRAADVFHHKGNPVYPARIEHALHTHASVRDAVVYGSEDGQVCAVVDIADADIDPATLLSAVRSQLAAHEVPTHIALTRNPLRNSAGKVRRSAFRAPIPSIV